MTRRIELGWRGDPMLKNELVRGARAGLFAKGGQALKMMRGFLFRWKTDDEQWLDAGRKAAERALAKGVGPVETPCTVTWTHLRATEHNVDTAAIAVPTWALLDGIVRAGMLPDDGKKYVLEQRYRVAVVGYEGIHCLIETVDAEVLVEGLRP